MAELGLNRQLAVITALLTKDTLAAGFYPSYLLVPLPFDQDRCLHSVEIGPPASLEFYNVSLEPFQLRVQQVREISRSGAQFTFQRNEVERRDGYSTVFQPRRAHSVAILGRAHTPSFFSSYANCENRGITPSPPKFVHSRLRLARRLIQKTFSFYQFSFAKSQPR